MRDFFLLLTSIVLGAFGQVAMKWGMMGVSQSETDGGFQLLYNAIHSLPVLIGLSLYGLSALLWVMVLARVPLSYAYPLVSLGYVVVVLMSFFWLGESLPLIRITGLVLICAGVCLIAIS